LLPVRWHGASRLARLRSLLSARGGEWLREWSSDKSALDFSLEPLDSGVGAGQWFATRASGGAVHACMASAAFDQLGRRLLGSNESDTLGLAAGVGRRAWSDLMRAWFAAASEADALSDAAAPSERALAVRHGVVGLLVQVAGVRIALYLDALVPVDKPAAALALSKRSDAMTQAEVGLEVVLDLGMAEIGQAFDLRPGEIIRTAVKLDTALTLRSTTGAVLARGQLIAQDGQRAIRISSISMQQGATS
jgi:hypothetical protein